MTVCHMTACHKLKENGEERIQPCRRLQKGLGKTGVFFHDRISLKKSSYCVMVDNEDKCLSCYFIMFLAYIQVKEGEGVKITLLFLNVKLTGYNCRDKI